MRSMTGYGRGRASQDGREVTVEIKTVNHRFLDIAFRMPRALSFSEDTARRLISGALHRGHADVSILYLNTREDSKAVTADVPLALAYRDALSKIAKATGAKWKEKTQDYAVLPDVLRVTEAEEDQTAVISLLSTALSQAIDGVCSARETEGKALLADLEAHLSTLCTLCDRIAARAPAVVDAYRSHLKERLAQVDLPSVDPQRLAQEVAIFADRAAIDEELSRLSAHIGQMRTLLGGEGETGRKLDFYTQEMNREVNTIGSKALDAEIAQYVVEAKSEIEKLREQVQNVE